MPVGNVVNGQLALFCCEGCIPSMPANLNTVPAQDGALFGGEKLFMLLERSVYAMPCVRSLAIAVGDAIEAVENTAVMRGMNLRIWIQAAGDNSVSIRRMDVMENLIGPNSTVRRGLVEPF